MKYRFFVNQLTRINNINENDHINILIAHFQIFQLLVSYENWADNNFQITFRIVWVIFY